MKKRVVYIMMFLLALLLSGCNLFKGLDKEDLNAPGAFEFKLDDAMANGDYTVVVGLIDNKIAGTPKLKAVDDAIGVKFDDIKNIDSSTSIAAIEAILQELTSYLNSNISKPEVKEYINLKVNQAEAQLGQSGLKMTDIIANITKSTSNSQGNLSRSISKNSNSGNDFSIADLVPSELDSEKLQGAIDSYLKSLPTEEGAAFNAIKNDKQLAYLNAALSSAINAINRFINVFKIPDSNPVAVVSSGAAFTDENTMSDIYSTEWNKHLPRIKAELKVALLYVNLYSKTGNSLITEEDRTKLNNDFSELIQKLDNFNKTNYDEFKTKAGL